MLFKDLCTTVPVAVCCLGVCSMLGCSRTPESAPAAATVAAPAVAIADHAVKLSAAPSEVAWIKGDVDAAFAAAKAANKPVFLYWGAVWCPPCNQVKATIFNRQDFIDRSRFFVPVYIDGDSPSAQKLGARFKVSGYPTMVLFKPDGTEITRLPEEVEAAQYMRVLAMGMNGARSARETLDSALAPASGAGPLAPEDWRMLAYYSWDTDEHRLVPAKDLAPTLHRLAQSCPATQPDTATRLRLRALAAEGTAEHIIPRDDKAAAAMVKQVLADPQLARANFDLLTYYSDNIVGVITLPKSPGRAELVTDWTTFLARFVDDLDLSTVERLNVLAAQVALAKLDASPKAAVPSPLLTTVREEVARASRDTTDPYARQAVIAAAAELLTEAGAMPESDALLNAELTRSHSPYYFMLDLADNAKKRGDKTAALAWNEKAYEAASGPATRLQWGVHYVSALVDLAPHDAPRIEKAAQNIIGELDPSPDTFYERNRRALERMGKKLAEWNRNRAHNASIARIRAQMADVCAKLPSNDPSRATCDGALRPSGAARA